MKNYKIRPLKENEIECRCSQVFESNGQPIGATILLYKDARVDINILNETFGLFGWQREHSRDNANCTVSIWDADEKHWVKKEDTGTESFTEKEKGLASDSFKRSCFNLGIGIELYTAPFIYLPAEKIKKWYENKQKKWAFKDKIRVKYIKTENGKIEQLCLFNETTKEDCFKWGM